MKTTKTLAILVLVSGLMAYPANGTLTLPYCGTTSIDGQAFWVSNTYEGAGMSYGGFFSAAGEEGEGVFGQSMGSLGIGVKGWAAKDGDVQNYGGHFCATGGRGIGVYGWAENTGDVENYGGCFYALGKRGIGVYAMGGPDGSAGVFEGDVGILGAGNGIIFPDGTRQVTAATGGGADFDWIITADNMYCGVSGNVGIGTVSPQGKLDVNGSIYQRGSRLHADYVFEPGFELESIDKHSEFMWQNKHLAAIPKVMVDGNGQEIVEVGAHRKGMVEELEKAHIYIEQLHKRVKVLEKKFVELERARDAGKE